MASVQFDPELEEEITNEEEEEETVLVPAQTIESVEPYIEDEEPNEVVEQDDEKEENSAVQEKLPESPIVDEVEPDNSGEDTELIVDDEDE